MDTSPLFNSSKIANLEISNRVVVAPLTRISAMPDGCVGPLMTEYYKSFAQGGFGLIITEGTYPDEHYSQTYINQSGIANTQQMQSWKPVVQAVHANGAKIIQQLMHAGALSQFNRFNDITKAPSAITPKGEQMALYHGKGPYKTPESMNENDIKVVIQGFVDAALRSKEAGFDGVEIHGANGYLLDQFLTDYMNTRSDAYGGSTQNRIRLTCEIANAVRQAVGPDFIVGVRSSQAKVNDYEHKWADGAKDAEIIYTNLAKTGVDYIHTTEYEADQAAFPDSLSLAAYARQFSKLPVIANGALHESKRALDVLNSGNADFVALGRGALANADWPMRIKAQLEVDEFNPEILSPFANLKSA